MVPDKRREDASGCHSAPLTPGEAHRAMKEFLCFHLVIGLKASGDHADAAFLAREQLGSPAHPHYFFIGA